MTPTLRNRLLLGLAPLLAILIALGLWAIAMISRLGGNIDVILRENYTSVRAAQDMKEALERMDSAMLFAIGGQLDRARAQYAQYRPIFETNLRTEQNNVTLPGEQELADRLTTLFGDYTRLADRFLKMSVEPSEDRNRLYFDELLPTFDKIKNTADEVLEINQRNMEEMDTQARAAAARSSRLMIAALIGAVGLATATAFLLSRSILGPIRSVTAAAQAIAGGDRNQVVPVLTRDELGQLASSFNAMARRLREFHESGAARLIRARRTAQATIDSFPDPVVIVGPSGAVERANPAAGRLLGVVPPPEGDEPTHATENGAVVPWTPPGNLDASLDRVLGGGPDELPSGFDQAVAIRDGGQERWFLPRVLAIRADDGGALGAAVVLSEVTRFRLLDQLKSDMVSTVSHELKTPLTGLRMAIHLLLEEAVGPLNAKQVELLLAARQDGERLLAMVNDLLDLTRIEQGRLKLQLEAVTPSELVDQARQRHQVRAEDARIGIRIEVEPNLPAVRADRERIAHVFDNLIGNALDHADPGGLVTLSARTGEVPETIVFAVSDTGEGIPPEHLSRIFEKFYRVPGSRRRNPGGVGLGLAITREILQAHGGAIEAASEPGHTMFAFTLPTTSGEASP